MIISLIALVSGLLFSFGLTISGMTDPEVVIGFLDIFGDWDYSLVFVMVGAILFNVIFLYFFKGEKPIFNSIFSMPTKNEIDWRLISGAALFGIGWGLIGICPGPGIVNLVSMNTDIITFVFSMLIGMVLFKFTLDKK